MIEEMKAALQTELAEFKKNLSAYAEKSDIDKRFAELSEKMNDAGMKKEIEDLTKAVEKQAELIEKLNAPKNESKTFAELVAEACKMARELGESKRSHTFEIKTNVLRTSVTNSTQAMRLPDVGQLAYGSTGLETIFRQGTVSPNSNGVIRYIDQSSVTRNADNKAEAAAFPESAITWQEYTLPLQKIVDSIPVSYEALQDVNWIESELRRLLEVNLAIKSNQQFWTGSGVAPQIKGIYTYATAFDAAAYAAGSGIKVAGATLYDLLAILKTTISNGKQSKYSADIVILNPADVLKMKLAKDEFGQYIIPPFTANNGMQVDGMRVIENSVVTANTMLLGDSRYATAYSLGGVEIEMGYGDGQFISDMYMIKARKRAALLVRNADLDAWLKVTDIDAAVTAVTPAP